MASPQASKLSRAEAIAASGLSQRTFARRESQGQIRGQFLDGRKWYMPEDVERLAELPDEEDPLAWAMTALRSTQAHCESLIRTITDPQKAANTHYAAMTESQSKRIEQLEERWQSMMVVHETVMSMQNERELKLAKTKLNQETRAKLVDLLREHGPALAERVMGARDVLNVLRRWAKTDKPEVIMTADGWLDEADREWFGGLIARLRAEAREKEASSERAAEEPQPKTESDDGGVFSKPPPGGDGQPPAVAGDSGGRAAGSDRRARRGGAPRKAGKRDGHRNDGGSESVT
jgi:hypothetical protein